MQTQRVVAIVNEKGGTAKTSTTVNLSAALGDLGKRVLLVDLDGQAASSRWMGVEEDNRLAEALCQGGGLEPIPDVAPGVSLAPASGKLDSVAHDLRPTQGGQLRKVLSQMKGFDYIFIDCPPSLGNRLIGNAFLAATHVIVPVETSILALDGLRILLTTLEDVREGFGHEITLGGVLACRFDARTKLSGLVLAELRRALPGKVFDTVIRENVRMRECPASGQSILQFAPDSNAAKDYSALAKEILSSPEMWDHGKETPEEAEGGRLRVDGLRAKAAEKVREFAGKSSWRKPQAAGPVEEAKQTSEDDSEDTQKQAEDAQTPVVSATTPVPQPTSTEAPQAPAEPEGQEPNAEVSDDSADATIVPAADESADDPVSEAEETPVATEPEKPIAALNADAATPDPEAKDTEDTEDAADAEYAEEPETSSDEESVDIESAHAPAPVPPEWLKRTEAPSAGGPQELAAAGPQEAEAEEPPVPIQETDGNSDEPEASDSDEPQESDCDPEDDMAAWRKRLAEAQRRLQEEEEQIEVSEETDGEAPHPGAETEEEPGEPAAGETGLAASAPSEEPTSVAGPQPSKPAGFRPDNGGANPFAPPAGHGASLPNTGAAGPRFPAPFGGLPIPSPAAKDGKPPLDRFTTRRTRPGEAAASPDGAEAPAGPSPAGIPAPDLAEQLRLDRLSPEGAEKDNGDNGEKYPALRAHLRQMKQEGKLPDDKSEESEDGKQDGGKSSGLRKLFRKMAGAD